MKGLPASAALTRLRFVDKRAAEPVIRGIKTAVANAKNNFKQDENKLVVESVGVGVGPTLKRGKAVSRGQYHRIKKRTSHLTVTLKSNE